MIDIKLIRENPELVKENIKKKFQNDKLSLVDKVRKLDEEWRKLKTEADKLRAERNKISEEINKAKKAKDEKKAWDLIKKAKEIPEKIEKIEEKTAKLEEEIKQIMYTIPNIIHKSVPRGRDSSENVERKKIGKPKTPKFPVLHHAELAEKLGGVDFDSARETSGNGFYFLKGKLAILHEAILAFARDYMIKQGFEFLIPPFMIRRKVVDGVMSFKEVEVMMYKIENEDLYLIGTSEHSMIGRFIDKTLKKNELPIILTSYSPCFRKEVGAHGMEEKGFYRLHQFEKQEMIVICEPEDSYKWYDKMLQFTIDVFRALDVPVRVLECCSGDLADLKAKSCDVEAWSPRQKKYFEVGSLTNMEAAQARRLNIKIEGKEGKYFAHTLNNTVLASPRALIALMENNQTEKGEIKIPKALWKYTGFKEIKPEKAEKKKKK
ncbi:serine--tRNA ligase [Candidatus Pacearchaeota archaeon]|nr:serine--tRNA ligase [Candidatus Pacearchaeota archaeon]